MLSEPHLRDIVQLVRAVARSEIMPRFRNLSAGDVATKSGPLDLVTVADEQAEQRLGAGLLQMFPGATVVGEEAATRDPALLGRVGADPLCFVVDPVDGTANFAAGLPLFGVIVAVVEHGRTTGSVIHDPVGDETAVALSRHGAWMERADGACQTLQVSVPGPAGSMAGSVSWRYLPEPRRSQFCARLPRVAAAWDYRCAAHQYRMLAAGSCDYAVYHRLLPWDHAAGVLLHREAGGYSARLDGSDYKPGETNGGLICAPDQTSWSALRSAFYGEE